MVYGNEMKDKVEQLKSRIQELEQQLAEEKQGIDYLCTNVALLQAQNAKLSIENAGYINKIKELERRLAWSGVCEACKEKSIITADKYREQNATLAQANALLVEALEKIADWNNTTAAEFAAATLKDYHNSQNQEVERWNKSLKETITNRHPDSCDCGECYDAAHRKAMAIRGISI